MNQARKDIHYGDGMTFGVTGKGVGVAILDTGIYLHEDFGHRVVGFADFVNHKKECYDDNGHGTHVDGETHNFRIFLPIFR